MPFRKKEIHDFEEERLWGLSTAALSLLLDYGTTVDLSLEGHFPWKSCTFVIWSVTGAVAGPVRSVRLGVNGSSISILYVYKMTNSLEIPLTVDCFELQVLCALYRKERQSKDHTTPFILFTFKTVPTVSFSSVTCVS